MRRLFAPFTAAFLLLQGCDKQSQTPPQTIRSDTVLMLTAQNVQIALISNFGFMDAMFSKGDGRGFSSFYVDTATLHRAGIGPVHGRDSISDLVRGMDAVGAGGFQRMSEGFQIENRQVTDSGTYSILSAIPLGPTVLAQQGRYKTRWTFTPQGEWLILSDSLIGQPKKK